MESKKENDECVVIQPSKEKKFKQATLPFKSLTPTALTETPSKKRKLSPSASHKIEKIARRDNIDVGVADDDAEEDPDKITIAQEKKPDKKTPIKPNMLTKFLEKGSSTLSTPKPPPKPLPSVPVIILNRCDDTSRKKVENANGKNESRIEEAALKTLVADVTNSDGEEAHEGSTHGKDANDSLLDVSDVNSDTESESSSTDNDSDDKNDGSDGDRKAESAEKTPTSDKITKKLAKKRPLTPKQLEKKMESEKKREERKRLKAEKEKQRIEDKMLRRQQLEAAREQKRKEKEQKDLKKQMEIEQRQREKERKEKAREEDRRKREEAKEEEKRKKEEEKRELERKKQKVASMFVSFFVKQETKAATEEKNTGACNFMPFEIKADMKVAPTCRRRLSDDEKSKFESQCLSDSSKSSPLYLTEIKDDKTKIRSSGKTWPADAKDDVVIIEEDDIGSANMVDQVREAVEKHRVKHLIFCENRRLPYKGTWRKKSSMITPRRPFAKDTKWFDYEVDSDEEWEEEDPDGESLRGSDEEKDEENQEEDEYDVDNEFMVPHGYLSDEEAKAADEEEEDMSPETQKLKLKVLGEQWEAERSEKTTKLKPKVVGCIWLGPLNSYPESIPWKWVNFLKSRQAWLPETPIVLNTSIDSETSMTTDAMTAPKKPSTPGAKKTRVPNEILPELIRLIHGNPYGRSFLVKEFIAYCQKKHLSEEQTLSKVSVEMKIRELARRTSCPEEGPMYLKPCWYVPEETRKKYLSEDLTLPNKWVYVLTPKRKAADEAEKSDKETERDKDVRDREKKSVPLITQFTKKITQEEMKKQLSVKPPPAPNKTPKRVALISVARGEQFPKSSILNAFSKAQAAAPGTANSLITIPSSPEAKKAPEDSGKNDSIV